MIDFEIQLNKLPNKRNRGKVHQMTEHLTLMIKLAVNFRVTSTLVCQKRLKTLFLRVNSLSSASLLQSY